MHRIKARNEAEQQWLVETAEALACAEQLAARLVKLRGSSALEPVLAIQAEIALLRNRVDQLERQGARQDFDPHWLQSSAWASHQG